MTFTTKLVLTLSMLSALSAQAAGLVVVANIDETNVTIKKRQVRDIFMGNNSELLLKPIALAPNSESRVIFNTKIVGLTESRIQSYWAQMRFSGRKKPPQEFASVEKMLAFVQNNKGTVTYVPAETEIPVGLTVIYQTE